MAWNDPLTTHLLDFLFELERNGLKTPLTIAGGFGLFLKRRYLAERKERTLLDMHRARATEDIDIFVRLDVLCDLQQSQSIVDTLHHLGYEAVEEAKYMQWKKPIELSGLTGSIKIDFLVKNVDARRRDLHIKEIRVRNPQVEGFHARITPEALLIDEKALEIPLSGRRSDGEEYETRICIPHPFTYLIMKLFAFRDRQDDLNKQHHAFDVFSIVGLLTERELDETIELGTHHAQEPTVREARQIVKDCFTGTSPSGMIAIKTHPLFQSFGAEHYDAFLETLMEVFGVIL